MGVGKTLVAAGCAALVLMIAAGCVPQSEDSGGSVRGSTFAKSYGGEGHDQANAVAPTADGGFIMAGVVDAVTKTSRSNIVPIDNALLGGFNEGDLWVQKLNADGDVELTRSFGDLGLGMLAVYDIRRAGDGGHIVAGHGSDDRVRVVKLDANGHASWARSYDSGRQDGPFSVLIESPRRIRQTRDGGYVVVGVSTANGPNGRTLDNALVMRLGAAGELRWRRTFDENARDPQPPTGAIPLAQARDVIELSARPGFIVVGVTDSDDGLTANFGLLMRLTDAGDVVWSRPGRFGNRFDYSDANASDGVSPDETLFWSFAGVTEPRDGRFVAVGGSFGHGDRAEDGALLVFFNDNGDLLASNVDNTLGAAEAVVLSPEPPPQVPSIVTVGRNSSTQIYAHKQEETGAVELWTSLFSTGGPPAFINNVKLEVLDLRLATDGSILMSGEDSGELLVQRLDRDGRLQARQRYATAERQFPSLISHAVEFASDGGILAGGLALDTGRDPFRDGGRLLRADAAGALLWRRGGGGDGVDPNFAGDQVHAIVQTPDGGYLVAGEMRHLLTADGGSDLRAWLLKLRPDLSIEWQRSYDAERFLALVGLPEGGYALAGADGSDALVARLDAGGNLLWQTRLRRVDQRVDRARALRRTLDGGLIVLVSGERVTSNDVDEAMLAKLDASGAVQWQRQYGLGPDALEARTFRGRGVDLAHGGGYVVAGSGIIQGRGLDAIVFRVDDAGELLWQHAYGGPENDEAFSIRATPDRGYLVAGALRSFNRAAPCIVTTTQTQVTPCADIWVLKLNEFGRIGVDASGNGLSQPITFDRVFATALDDLAYAAEPTADGGFIVAGVTNGITATADAWLLKIDAFGGISEQCPSGLRPAPADGQIFDTADVHSTIVSELGEAANLLPADTDILPFSPVTLDTRQCRGLLLEPTHPLTLTVAGQGTVTASGQPRHLVCRGPSTCREVFDRGSTVQITLEPDTGWRTATVSGDCTATALSLTLDGPKVCTVSFERIAGQAVLTVAVSGGGRVTEGTRIDCMTGSGDCAESVNIGSRLVLTADTASTGKALIGFTGCDMVIERHCTVTVESDRTVSADFSASARLAVSVTGSGRVRSAPGGISCIAGGTGCAADFLPNSTVTLTATPGTLQILLGWDGCASATGNVCTVFMHQNRDVRARFGAEGFRQLVVRKTGGGSGRVTGPGIDCGADCEHVYQGETVTLEAVPDAGSLLTRWIGCDRVTGSQCVVDMNTPRLVTAEFGPAFTLTVTRNGAGTVTSNPAGINCGVDCSQDYAPNTVITLVPTAAPGQLFSAWSGHADCSDGQVTMDANKTCTATFVPAPPNDFLLIVERQQNPAGNGTVTSSPAGINCGIDCDEEYAPGTQVVLTATPDANSVFERWDGCDSVSGTQCTVTVNVNNRRVSAVFGRRA